MKNSELVNSFRTQYLKKLKDEDFFLTEKIGIFLGILPLFKNNPQTVNNQFEYDRMLELVQKLILRQAETRKHLAFIEDLERAWELLYLKEKAQRKIARRRIN